MSESSLLDWLRTISSYHSKKIDLTLDRVKKIFRAIPFSCPTIVVAGTNGKGSVIRLLESVYLRAGYRVAAYTSPHLVDFRERLRINDELVSAKDWMRAFEEIDYLRQGEALTFFEFTTLAAFWLCSKQDLDLCLFEIGLGGRLDAVNLVDSILSIITSIDLDHMNYLGNTRDAIAFEKSGVMRSGCPVVCGDPCPPDSLMHQANQIGAIPFVLGRDFSSVPVVDLPQSDLFIAADYVALVEKVIDLLSVNYPVLVSDFCSALAKVSLPGRYELFNFSNCLGVMDVAHNPAALQRLYHRFILDRRFASGRLIGICGFMADKDWRSGLQPWLGRVDQWFLPPLSDDRALSVHELAGYFQACGSKVCYTEGEVSCLAVSLRKNLNAGDKIVVFGSFLTASWVKQNLV